MSFVKCFDAVTMVTDEATAQFGVTLKKSQQKEESLASICKKIDSLVAEFDGQSFEVEVDDITTDIKISVEFANEIEVSGKDNDFYSVIASTKAVSIKKCIDNGVQIDFVFNGIWEPGI